MAKEAMAAGPRVSLLLAGAAAALAAALLLQNWAAEDGAVVWPAAEVSPYRGVEPFRVQQSTHKYKDHYTAQGWRSYLESTYIMLFFYVIAWIVWPGDHLRHLQILNVVETGGLNFGGAFGQYPQYPVPTAHHDAHSAASRLARVVLPWSIGGFLLGWLCRLRAATLDNFSLLLAGLDVLPNLWGSPHVYQRPTHNLRLLVLSFSSPASRSRAWSIIMGLFYLGTGLPKCWPAFYRYWLWYGIYPSSTLSLLPPELVFYRGDDGGLHPNALAQLFGFAAGVLETTMAVLHIVPISTRAWRGLRCALGVVTHASIIAGRFDNGLAGWNMSWLLQGLAHSLASHDEVRSGRVAPLARAVVLAEVALLALFFCGHGSYHSGMSHHTGNFRMQWLVLHGDAAWGKFASGLASAGRTEACSTEFPTCVHSWDHGTHYPTASHEAFIYALAGGTAMEDVLPGVARNNSHAWPEEAGPQGVSRAMFLGFSSGWSIWDDAFYARWAAQSVRDGCGCQPGECHYVELDRQKLWLRTRWLTVWDLGRRGPGAAAGSWSPLDGALGGPPLGEPIVQRALPVRRPFPGT